ncbi:FAD-dependent monooxygenase [Actibacterium sp. MT2.3-13A]|uniref:FAD-dependent monooxygenase n=1 Tax=Actibacterium sp. MT2.3-13A TaxID=2828332 RepID=UPI001BA7CD90|nr:FAD-dependent monooxygenase [Actibacterium sp. MT2.3-13A]
MTYDYRPYPYARPPGLSAPEPARQVIIVGAGPVGLAMAIELANHGVASVVLDDNNVVSMGSRAISWSRRSLEIFDRLGIAERVMDKAVPWRRGRMFRGETELFRTDLQTQTEAEGIADGHAFPVFANLQQYYVEEYLIERIDALDLVDLRVRNRVLAVEQSDDGAHVTVETPDGDYGLRAEYVIACDGVRSSIRSRLKLEFEGVQFEDRFVIADLEMETDLPAERQFWFEPPFHDGRTALLHKQPDNLWRLDLQLNPDDDAEEAVKPDHLRPRIAAMLGHGNFRLDWVSLYSFQCRRLADLVHGRLIFAGDAAHVVSPFGARGGNGGLQDVDNLGWKLAAVLQGRAAPDLLESYDRERGLAADANLRSAARTARFMSPAPGAERLFRDQVLALAAKASFARPMVDSGRLSVPCRFPSSGADDSRLPRASRPGSVAPDAPQGNGWLLPELAGEPALLALGGAAPDLGLRVIEAELNEATRARYLGEADQALYLIRPDQVVAARWVAAETAAITAAITAMWEGRP